MRQKSEVIVEQLQNTRPFFVVYYLSRLVGSPVALSVYRTSKVYKVYYLVVQRLVGSPVELSVYRTSKVYTGEPTSRRATK